MELRIRDLDPELHRQLKMICVRDGVSLDSRMKEIIEDYVNTDMEKQGKGGKAKK